MTARLLTLSLALLVFSPVAASAQSVLVIYDVTGTAT